MTISRHGRISWRWRRKNSRRTLFIRLRTTAFPTRVLTVMPSRLSPISFVSLMTTKCEVWTFLPPRDRFRNSERLVRRAFFGNLSPPAAIAESSIVLVARARPRSRITDTRHVPQERALFGGTTTVNFLRPFALLRLRTFRPPGVSIRARKPCVLLRRTLLG